MIVRRDIKCSWYALKFFIYFFSFILLLRDIRSYLTCIYLSLISYPKHSSPRLFRLKYTLLNYKASRRLLSISITFTLTPLKADEPARLNEDGRKRVYPFKQVFQAHLKNTWQELECDGNRAVRFITTV